MLMPLCHARCYYAMLERCRQMPALMLYAMPLIAYAVFDAPFFRQAVALLERYTRKSAKMARWRAMRDADASAASTC